MDSLTFSNPAVFTPEQEQRARDMRVCVVGAGGLGGFVCEGLARLGVSDILIIDPDRFEQSNLNRQLYSDTLTLGEGKAATAANRLTLINPDIKATAHTARLTRNNAPELLQGRECVFDCADNARARLAAEAYCVKNGVPLIHGGVSGDYGQAALIVGEPILRHMFAHETRGENSVVAPMLIAALQLKLFCDVVRGHRETSVLAADLNTGTTQKL